MKMAALVEAGPSPLDDVDVVELKALDVPVVCGDVGDE